MPPRKEKEIPKKYVDSEVEEETSQDTSIDESPKKRTLYDGKGRLLRTGEDLCDCLDQVYSLLGC